MSKYGVKIKNIDAGTLYEANLGVREFFSYTNAMLTTSLLYYFLLENGMKTWNGKSTRDIICLDFKWGSRSYQEEEKHINNLIKEIDKKIIDPQEKEEKLSKLNDIAKKAELNKDKYIKHSKEWIRTEFYKNGVDVTYVTKDKDGEVTEREVIHYKKLYRTAGKAKKGSCIFIREELYEKAYNFISMGLSMPDKDAPIVELNAYIPLVASTIVDRIKINPRNILILEDIDSFFNTKVVSVEVDENKQCVAKTIDDYTVKNTMFDGQALIDSSIFPKDGNGYILLRHHFCKMASFNTNIQQFFKDYYKDDYYDAKVVDMFGNEHYAKDIELITTDGAMKWLKFDSISYDYWCNRVYENNCMFGIVKTAHKSKLGEVQRMSYQMVNALDLDIMENVVSESVSYIEKLKQDDDTFLEYLRLNANFSKDYEVLVALVEQNRDFLRCDYFRKRKDFIIRSYIKLLQRGKIIQNADNLVIVGSPYAMLLHSVGDNVQNDVTFKQEANAIQCYTEMFNDNEYLASFRSPFNSKNNMGYLHNIHSKEMKKYFNFGEQVIAVNLRNTDFQDRNNGSDQDSDTLYVTNQPDIVKCALNCYVNYPTIVNNIPKEKKKYDNKLSHHALIDNNLARASTVIGESSNLAQLALTYTYNYDDQKYKDCVCILSVLAQVAIDNAKRKFDIDLEQEVKRLKGLLDIEKNKYPVFWGLIKSQPKKKSKSKFLPENKKSGFNESKINKDLKCPMNYLSQVKYKEYKSKTSTLPISYFFNKFDLDTHRRKNKKVEQLIEDFSLQLYDYRCENSDNENERNSDYLLLRSDYENLIDKISKTSISSNYIGLFSWLIDRAFIVGAGVKRNSETKTNNTGKNKSLLLKTLYDVNSKALLRVFSKNM